jgi:hypothetical protein
MGAHFRILEQQILPQVLRGHRMLEHGFRIDRGSGALTKPAGGVAVPKF